VKPDVKPDEYIIGLVIFYGSQTAAAKALGISQSHLSRIVRGLAEPSQSVAKLAEILHGGIAHGDGTEAGGRGSDQGPA